MESVDFNQRTPKMLTAWLISGGTKDVMKFKLIMAWHDLYCSALVRPAVSF